jgi:hypothetical protein
MASYQEHLLVGVQEGLSIAFMMRILILVMLCNVV